VRRVRLPCPRSSKHWGIASWGVRRAAAEALGRSATPKPCPRSSKHWGIATVLFAVRQRRRWANSATPKPCPRSSKHWGIAMFAVRQRRRWEDRRPQAVPALIQALGDSDSAVRRAAAEALGAIGDPQAVPALIQALGDRGDVCGRVLFAVRQRRRWALGESATPKPCPRSSKHWGIGLGMFAVRQRSVANFAVRAAEALVRQRIGDPQAVPALIQALGDSDSDVRRAAAEALGKLGDPQAVPALIQALGDSEWDVRRAAAEALGATRRPPSRARAHPSTGG
jgi:hypothetical protein